LDADGSLLDVIDPVRGSDIAFVGFDVDVVVVVDDAIDVALVVVVDVAEVNNAGGRGSVTVVEFLRTP